MKIKYWNGLLIKKVSLKHICSISCYLLSRYRYIYLVPIEYCVGKINFTYLLIIAYYSILNFLDKKSSKKALNGNNNIKYIQKQLQPSGRLTYIIYLCRPHLI